MTNIRRTAALIFAAIASGIASNAAAAEATMPTGVRTSQPIGHYEFCKQRPRECAAQSASSSAERMNPALMRLLVSVNNTVNAAVEPRTDMEIWGKEEVWSYPDGVGDCEDYVLEKRRRLIFAGLSPANTLITVVRQQNGEGHAVLTVRTSDGDFILDNLENGVKRWDRTPYTYLKRQSEKHAGRWLAIHDGRADAVASVR